MRFFALFPFFLVCWLACLDEPIKKRGCRPIGNLMIFITRGESWSRVLIVAYMTVTVVNCLLNIEVIVTWLDR